MTTSSGWTFDTSPQACIARVERWRPPTASTSSRPRRAPGHRTRCSTTPSSSSAASQDPEFYRAIRLAVAAAASDFQAAYALEDRAEIVYQRLRVPGDEWAFNC